MSEEERERDQEPAQQQGGHRPGHRADRLGQDHDALLRAAHGSERRRQHRHRRGPGRIPAGRGHRPGAGAREGGTHLRGGAPVDPPPGPGRRAGRRDPRRGRRRRSRCRPSLTGHLVLSTLHTNDAPNAITRLVDMGMEPYKIGLRAPRRDRAAAHCGGSVPRCREVNDGDDPDRIRRYIPRGTTLYRAVGCPDCAMTGYRGRFSVVEILTDERRAGAEDRAGRHGGQDRRSRQGATA